MSQMAVSSSHDDEAGVDEREKAGRCGHPTVHKLSDVTAADRLLQRNDVGNTGRNVGRSNRSANNVSVCSIMSFEDGISNELNLPFLAALIDSVIGRRRKAAMCLLID
jgi:hypothetical protein